MKSVPQVGVAKIQHRLSNRTFRLDNLWYIARSTTYCEKSTMLRSRRVYREQEGQQIPGISLLAFIHNGPAYYLTEIKVYRDGMVDCWELVDLDEFKKKVASGWVVTTLPEGAEISISLLCGFHATN